MANKKKPPNEAEENIKKDQKASEADTCSCKEDKTATDIEKSAEMADMLAREAHKLACELKDEKDKYVRLAAEYDNFRKRSQKERENIYGDVRADTVLKFLPVFDNLERAISQPTTDEAYAKGVEMIMTQLREVLEKLGVSEIPAAAGTSFDPSVHNAVMHEEREDLGESVIVEEFQKGFRLGDKVIRFSTVKVAN